MNKPKYQIRRVDGLWWSGEDWVDGSQAATFAASELPNMIGIHPARWMHQEFAMREGLSWFHSGKRVIKAVYVGEE